MNPADGPSRRPDYLANAEEVNSTPASRLLPVLRDRLDQNESIEKTIKSADEFNDRTRAARFPIVPRAVNAIDTAIIRMHPCLLLLLLTSLLRVSKN